MKRSIKIAATTAAAVSSAMLVKKKKIRIVILNLVNMIKILKEFIIQMVTMKHLLDLKNLKV